MFITFKMVEKEGEMNVFKKYLGQQFPQAELA